MRFSVVCSPGVGDLAILHIVSHHLVLAGHEVITVSPHRFGKWLDRYQFGELGPSDAIFLQHDNSPRSNEIRQMKNVYTFFGSHKESKHGPLKPGFDFVADLNQSMVTNIVTCLKTLFGIQATTENGFSPPQGLVHKRFPKRIAIHTSSGLPFRNWPYKKFQKFIDWARKEGFEPAPFSQFSTLEELSSFIYESGYFLGNDSGPGHLASYLKIPNLIIGREERHMRHWRPGWGYNTVITPPKWVPNFGSFRIRENYWSQFITARSVINAFKQMSQNFQ